MGISNGQLSPLQGMAGLKATPRIEPDACLIIEPSTGHNAGEINERIRLWHGYYLVSRESSKSHSPSA